MDETTTPERMAAKDEPEVEEPRAALVAEWVEKIKKARDAPRTKEAFKRMRSNMAFAARGAEEDWIKNGKYVVPITNRHINLSVSQLYAKNPTVQARPRRKLFHKLWDGKMESLQAATEAAALGDPMAMQMLQEVAAGVQYKTMLKRMGDTLDRWCAGTAETLVALRAHVDAANAACAHRREREAAVEKMVGTLTEQLKQRAADEALEGDAVEYASGEYRDEHARTARGRRPGGGRMRRGRDEFDGMAGAR